MIIFTLILIYLLTILIIIVITSCLLVYLIKNKTNPTIKGNNGENKIADMLAKYNNNACIIRNLYIKNNNATSEIDIVYIHPSALIIIENKNYSGWIYGNENQQYWTQTFKNGKKYKFYNPIKQNNTHKNIIIDELKRNGINTNVFPIYSMIIFDNNNIKNITYDNTKTIITTRNNLYNALNKCIYSKPQITNITQLENILSRYANADEQTKNEHIQRINARYK